MLKKITLPLLLCSMFYTQNALTNDTMIESMKAMAHGIALSFVSGAVTELIHPFPTDRWSIFIDPTHPFIATVAATLGMAMTWYNSEKSHITGYAPFITSFAAFFAGYYTYGISIGVAKTIKENFLNWYNKRYKHSNKTTPKSTINPTVPQ